MTNPNNRIEDLRDILFETLRAVKDGHISIERSKAVSDLTQTIVNTAKIEVEFIKATKNRVQGTGFLAGANVLLPEPDAKPEADAGAK